MRKKQLPTPAYEVAEVELVYKTKIDFSKRPQIKGSRCTYELLLNLWDKNKIELQEQFKVVLLR